MHLCKSPPTRQQEALRRRWLSGMIGCSEESSIPDEQPGSYQSIEDTKVYASDLIHEARLAGWKPGIKDDVTCWVVRQTEFIRGSRAVISCTRGGRSRSACKREIVL